MSNYEDRSGGASESAYAKADERTWGRQSMFQSAARAKSDPYDNSWDNYFGRRGDDPPPPALVGAKPK